MPVQYSYVCQEYYMYSALLKNQQFEFVLLSLMQTQTRDTPHFDYEYYSNDECFSMKRSGLSRLPRGSSSTDDRLYARVMMRRLDFSILPPPQNDIKNTYFVCSCSDFNTSGKLKLKPIAEQRDVDLVSTLECANVCCHTTYLYCHHFGYSKLQVLEHLQKVLQLAFVIQEKHINYRVNRFYRQFTAPSLTDTKQDCKLSFGRNIVDIDEKNDREIKTDTKRDESPYSDVYYKRDFSSRPIVVQRNANDEKCCICLCHMNDVSCISTCVSCSKSIHQICIDKWTSFQLQNDVSDSNDSDVDVTCPLCRNPFS